MVQPKVYHQDRPASPAERARAYRERKRDALQPSVTIKRDAVPPAKRDALQPSVTIKRDDTNAGGRARRKARAGDKQIAQWMADELKAMGVSSSDPKAKQNAIARMRPRLSELDNKRSDAAFIKVYDRHWPQLQIDGWTVQLQQFFQKSTDEVRKPIDALLSVAGPSGGPDYIDGVIAEATCGGKAKSSKPRAWDWLWFQFRKMKQQPGFRWEIRPRKPGSSKLDAVEMALGDVPQHFSEIANTIDLDPKQVRGRLAVLRRCQRAFPHGRGTWARTRRETPQLSLSDKIWLALDDGREAHYTELADELHEERSAICSRLSRMKDGVKGKKVVKTPDGKYKRSQ